MALNQCHHVQLDLKDAHASSWWCCDGKEGHEGEHILPPNGPQGIGPWIVRGEPTAPLQPASP